MSVPAKTCYPKFDSVGLCPSFVALLVMAHFEEKISLDFELKVENLNSCSADKRMKRQAKEACSAHHLSKDLKEGSEWPGGLCSCHSS